MATVASNRNPTERNAEATVHVAQLDEKVTDAILWELMVQAGPVRHVYIPRNRITGSHFGYGFCEFHTPLDAYYATKVLSMVKLYSRPIRISQSTVDRTSNDVGANLFVGNLVEDVDEKVLHDAFSSFGPLVDAPYIMRASNSTSRRYGFVKYTRFEHADAAIAAMNGQYICNHPITVQFAFKKDSDGRERHGSQAERILAARALTAQTNSVADRLKPNTMFSDRPAKREPVREPALQPSVQPPPTGLPPPYYPYPPMQPMQPMHHGNPHLPPHMPYAPVGGPMPRAPVALNASNAWPQTNMQHPNSAPPMAMHPSHPPPYPHHFEMPRQSFQRYPDGQRATAVGWSHGRHPGAQAPSSSMDPRQTVSNAYASHNAPRPVEDEEAPPPPTR